MIGGSNMSGTRCWSWSWAACALGGFCWAASSVSAQTLGVTAPPAAGQVPQPVTCAVPAIVASPVSPGKVTVASGGEVASKSNAKIRQWTIQVASFESMGDAQAMQQSLCQHGFEARVVGANRPYIVRVGRYPTSQDALAIARHLSGPKRTVFVTPAER
jgi:cell division protein FtsN